MTAKHTDIVVLLTGQNGNDFAIPGRCREAAQDAGINLPHIGSSMLPSRIAVMSSGVLSGCVARSMPVS